MDPKELKENDRVRRIDGTPFLECAYEGIVDQIVPRSGGEGTIVFVTTRHSAYNNTQTVEVEEIEKVEDYKITIDQFIEEMYYWLINKSVRTKGKEKDAYKDVLGMLIELKKHIGY